MTSYVKPLAIHRIGSNVHAALRMHCLVARDVFVVTIIFMPTDKYSQARRYHVSQKQNFTFYPPNPKSKSNL